MRKRKGVKREPFFPQTKEKKMWGKVLFMPSPLLSEDHARIGEELYSYVPLNATERSHLRLPQSRTELG